MLGLNGSPSKGNLLPPTALADARKAAVLRRQQQRESGELYALEDEQGNPLSIGEVKAGQDGRGRAISYAWTKRRNPTGHFVGFRIVRNADGEIVTRDKHTTAKRKSAVVHRSKARAAAFMQKTAGDRPASPAVHAAA